MPRHPPCALTHLTTTRCSHPLCNTQHTTTAPAPAPTNPTHGAVREPTGRGHQEHTHRCLLRTQQCAKPEAHRLDVFRRNTLCSTQRTHPNPHTEIKGQSECVSVKGPQPTSGTPTTR